MMIEEQNNAIRKEGTEVSTGDNYVKDSGACPKSEDKERHLYALRLKEPKVIGGIVWKSWREFKQEIQKEAENAERVISYLEIRLEEAENAKAVHMARKDKKEFKPGEWEWLDEKITQEVKECEEQLDRAEREYRKELKTEIVRIREIEGHVELYPICDFWEVLPKREEKAEDKEGVE